MERLPERAVLPRDMQGEGPETRGFKQSQAESDRDPGPAQRIPPPLESLQGLDEPAPDEPLRIVSDPMPLDRLLKRFQ